MYYLTIIYKYLHRKALLQIYKSFIRPHWAYCDVIYHKPIFDDFSSTYYSERAGTVPVNTNYQITNKIEGVQFNATQAITGCIRGIFREKPFSELGLTSFYDRRCFHRLSLVYKILNQLTPQYLRDFIPGSFRRLQVTLTNRDDVVSTRTRKYRYSFFPDTSNSWNHLSILIKTSPTLNIFNKRYNVLPNPIYIIQLV